MAINPLDSPQMTDAYDRLLASVGRVAPEVGSGRLTGHWSVVTSTTASLSWAKPSMAGSRIGPQPTRRARQAGRRSSTTRELCAPAAMTR